MTPSPLSVYVTGAVVWQGVARVEHAIAAAGGLTEDADERRCNQAAPLVDGQNIHCPFVSEVLEDPMDTRGGDVLSPQVVNINTATTLELTPLPAWGS
jgi:competence protein ComEA